MTCAALISGCSTVYDPGAQTPKLTEVASAAPAGSISLVNSQPAMDKVEISQHGTGYTVYAVPHEWTEDAIRSLTATLKKKGVVVVAGAQKSLKISLTKITLSSAGGGWAFRCTIVFTIDTGDGQPFTLGADDTSWKWPNACDAAMKKLVVVALNDDRVLKFLGSP
jgi:hypothetical protein